MPPRTLIPFCALIVLSVGDVLGAEAAEMDFLEIPVGGRAAALGGAYGALSSDAYAPAWNPAGLGFLETFQAAAMRLSYPSSISYDYGGLALPMGRAGGVGASAQVLDPGDIPSTDLSGASAGSFSGRQAAYTFAIGLRAGPMALGAAGRSIRTEIADASSGAWGLSAGGMLRPWEAASFSVVLENALGREERGDALAQAVRVGAGFQAARALLLAVEARFRPSEKAGLHAGVEWVPTPLISFRAGYRPASGAGTGGAALSAGMGLRLRSQRFDYSWTSLGDLGAVHCLSALFSWPSARAS